MLTTLPISASMTFTIGKRDDFKSHEHSLLPIYPHGKLSNAGVGYMLGCVYPDMCLARRCRFERKDYVQCASRS
jgi:hypothetical protein